MNVYNGKGVFASTAGLAGSLLKAGLCAGGSITKHGLKLGKNVVVAGGSTVKGLSKSILGGMFRKK